MSPLKKPSRLYCAMMLGLSLFATAGIAGCQVDLNGQTHPSPFYMSDDLQYFAPGPEFKAAREAAAQKAAQAEMNLQRRQ